MKVKKELIENVANLAKLNLTEHEKEKLTCEMSDIIKYMDKLNEADTSNAEPTVHVIPIKNVFREDVVGKSYDRDEILANAPTLDNGCFKVPKIVE